jgi:hypothetical protein
MERLQQVHLLTRSGRFFRSVGSSQASGMKHVDMRKLPAATQEERRRQVIGLRRSGMTKAIQAGSISAQ